MTTSVPRRRPCADVDDLVLTWMKGKTRGRCQYVTSKCETQKKQWPTCHCCVLTSPDKVHFCASTLLESPSPEWHGSWQRGVRAAYVHSDRLEIVDVGTVPRFVAVSRSIQTIEFFASLSVLIQFFSHRDIHWNQSVTPSHAGKPSLLNSLISENCRVVKATFHRCRDLPNSSETLGGRLKQAKMNFKLKLNLKVS